MVPGAEAAGVPRFGITVAPTAGCTGTATYAGRTSGGMAKAPCSEAKEAPA